MTSDTRIVVRGFIDHIVYCPNPSCYGKNIFEDVFYKEVKCEHCQRTYLYDVGDRKDGIG